MDNPNTPALWDKILVVQNKELLESSFYLDKIGKVTAFLQSKNGKFLDIGFGSGNLEREVVKQGLDLEIYGIDFSPQTVARAKKTIKGSFYVANIYKLPFKSGYFDVVAVLDVLEHIEPSKTKKAIMEIGRVLKKGGSLVVSVPLNENFKKLIKEGKNFNAHMREYTPHILEKELKSNSFKVEMIEFIYAFRNFYKLKTFVAKLFPGFRKPNLMIVFAKK